MLIFAGALYGIMDAIFNFGIGFRDIVDVAFAILLFGFFSPIIIAVGLVSISINGIGSNAFSLVNSFIIDLINSRTTIVLTHLVWVDFTDTGTWVTTFINILNAFKATLFSAGRTV